MCLDELEMFHGTKWMVVMTNAIYNRAEEMAWFWDIQPNKEILQGQKIWNNAKNRHLQPDEWPSSERAEAHRISEQVIERLLAYGYRETTYADG